MKLVGPVLIASGVAVIDDQSFHQVIDGARILDNEHFVGIGDLLSKPSQQASTVLTSKERAATNQYIWVIEENTCSVP